MSTTRHSTGAVRTGLRLIALTALLALIASVAQISGAFAQAGYSIENIATVDYETNGVPQARLTSDPAVLFVEPRDTQSELVLLRYAPGVAEATPTTINGAESSTNGEPGGTFVQQQPPSQNGGAPLSTAGPLPLAPVQSLIASEPLFIQVTDPGANLDPNVIDTVIVVVAVSLTGDQETLRLYETGPNTGVFVGYAQTEEGAGAWGDGVFQVRSGSVLTATYQDSLFPEDISVDSTIVDPYSRVFDSATGALVSGAEITLLDAGTGQPAEVWGVDRVATFPSTVMSGGQVADSSGFVYSFSNGQFRFPVVEPGDYILKITPPGAYEAPSVVTDPVLQQLPGAPWMLNGGSRGQMFPITIGPAVEVDIPLDISANLALVKTASEVVAGAGDFIRYELELTNRSGEETPPLTVLDNLPYGFRYQAGSLNVGGVPTEPVVSGDGGVLAFATPVMAPNERLKVTYVLEVTVAAPIGEAVNTAVATGAGGFQSNTAEAALRVRDEFMRDTTTIVGRVSAQACNPEDDWPREIVVGESVAKVRVYMEDGTFSVTDKDGQFHFQGVTPGTHVVQIDTASLPEGYEPVLCEENSRIAGRPTSRMVDLQGGSLWRADFYLKRTGAIAKPKTTAPKPGETPAEEKSEALIKKYDAAWLAKQDAKVEWVYPDPAAGVPFPGVKFAVKHGGDQKITVLLAGKEISPFNVAGSKRSGDGKVAITHWRGVDIKDGPNTFTVIAADKTGRETARFDQTIYYVTEAARARFAPELSVLDADGRTEPLIAVRITDGAGRPVHRGRMIEVEVAPPHRLAASRERFEANPLTEKNAASAGAIVGNDGVALIRLEPTTRSGGVQLKLKLDGSGDAKVEKAIDAWLKPEQRDWILVGLAEGTVAFKTVSGAMQSGGGDDIDVDGRVAFFAKGTIKGEWLLTVSLDTARRRGDADDKLFRQIDPNAYYTLYGDATQQDYEAESRYPLYIKLERPNFYAMFGDYDTGMNRTELAQYDRRLSGVKAAYRDEMFDVVAFGAETNQAFVKDEILSDGTSGPYRLSAAPVVRNSEKVVIETRDRFRNDILIGTRALVRYLDYSIDYDSGVITLNQPVPVTDTQFNPNILSIDYEAVNAESRDFTYGGRAAVKLMDGKVEVGASYIHEGGSLGDPDAKSDLGGVDATVKLTENTELHAEYARSRTKTEDGTAEGDAILVDVTHQTEDLTAHAYFRQEEAEFGLGQQSSATGTVRRYGVDGSYVLRRAGPDEKLPGTTTLNAEAFREESLDTDATRTVAEASVEHLGPRYDLMTGVRRIDYEAGDAGEDATVTQLIAGATYRFEALPLSVYTTNEVAIEGTSEFDFDSRYLVGADYRITEWLSVNAAYEFGESVGFSAQNLRAGISATPWKGGVLSLSAQNQMGMRENADRLAAAVGVSQSVALTDKISVSAGFEHQMMLSGDEVVGENAPFTNALLAEEFTVANLGFGYTGEGWSASARLEGRVDEQETRLTFNAGLTGDLSENLSAAAWVIGTATDPEDEEDGEVFRGLDLGLAAAYRPLDRGPIYLNRLDVSIEDGSETGTHAKIVNNFTSNFRLNERGQASIHVGAKYAMTDYDGASYEGFSYFVGGELRYDVTEKLDVGVHGGVAHSVNSGVFDYALGASVGYNVFENAWLSLGYNFEGLDDDDFGGANFTTEGVFLKFRFNFDQQTVRDVVNAARAN